MSGDQKLATAFLKTRPAVAAKFLETMDTLRAAEVLQAAPAPVAATVLSKMLPTSSARCAEKLASTTIGRLLEQLPILSGAALLRHLPQSTRSNVLTQVNAARATALRLLLRYPETAVGAWMNPSVLTLSSDFSPGEAAGILEREEHASSRIYVVDRDRRPQGAIVGVELLRQAHRGELSSLIEPVEPIWARETLVAAQFKDFWEQEADAPVVNRKGEFVGSISFADLIKGQRSASRRPTNEVRHDGVAEFTELFTHGFDSLWQSLTETFRSDSLRGQNNSDDKPS